MRGSVGLCMGSNTGASSSRKPADPIGNDAGEAIPTKSTPTPPVKKAKTAKTIPNAPVGDRVKTTAAQAMPSQHRTMLPTVPPMTTQDGQGITIYCYSCEEYAPPRVLGKIRGRPYWADCCRYQDPMVNKSIVKEHDGRHDSIMLSLIHI